VGFAVTEGGAFRREEHSVELTWSVKSCKTKLLWDGNDVSNLYTRRRLQPDMVEFSWMTQAGTNLRVVAHEEETEASNQYDLFVDGTSFFGFPALVELLPHETVPGREEKPASFPDMDETRRSDDGSCHETMSGTGSGGGFERMVPATDVNFRLSMVGLNKFAQQTSEVRDELHSELYSPILESLRTQISEYLPQLEDMVSRAIINAFFVDPDVAHDTLSSSSSSSSDGRSTKADPYQVEADTLCSTFEFVSRNRAKKEDEDLYLSCMQKQIDSVFIRVRNDELSPEQATRILLSAACVLELKFAKPIANDTVIFTGLSSSATDEDLYSALIQHGSVVATAVAAGSRGFGFCRFEDAASATTLKEAAGRNEFVVRGDSPASTRVLSEHLREKREDRGAAKSSEVDESTDDKTDDPTSYYPASPVNQGIPHLMAPLGSSDYETTFPLLYNMSSPVVGSPLNAETPTSLKTHPPSSERTCSTASILSDSDTEGGHHQHFKSNASSPQSVASLLDPRILPSSTRMPNVR